MVVRIGVSVAFALTALCCAAAIAQVASGPLERPAKPPPASTQADAAQPRRSETPPRSAVRPPSESVRPPIGPRTTQGLAADAISRSNGR
jgi:hypothetical protein